MNRRTFFIGLVMAALFLLPGGLGVMASNTAKVTFAVS